MDYITGLGITSFDYNFASHYHADHIGCLDDLLGAGVVLNVAGYDRGYSYTTATYTDYATALGAKRQTLSADQTITLDAGSANPVTIRCIALNGAGAYPVDGDDENAKSVVLRITCGAFDEVMGGDLTADSDNDVESVVGPAVGDVEVYKVHHHASATSTSDSWLSSTTPEVGVISVGDNTYGHPTAEALTRLHDHGVKTYWTEPGSGADPTAGWDKVGGTIVVQADPEPGAAYTVAGDGFTDTWYNGSGGGEELLAKTYVPTGVTMLIGTVGAGSYASLAADDGGYLRIDAAKVSRRYYTDWYAGLTIAETPVSLTVTWNGNYTQSGTQTLYLYDFTAAAWSQVDAADVGTTDATRSCVITTPAPFVSATGEIRVRVARDSSPRAYACNADYLACTVKYAAPAARIAIAAGDRERPDDAAPCLIGAVEAWPNPFNPLRPPQLRAGAGGAGTALRLRRRRPSGRDAGRRRPGAGGAHPGLERHRRAGRSPELGRLRGQARGGGGGILPQARPGALTDARRRDRARGGGRRAGRRPAISWLQPGAPTCVIAVRAGAGRPAPAEPEPRSRGHPHDDSPDSPGVTRLPGPRSPSRPARRPRRRHPHLARRRLRAAVPADGHDRARGRADPDRRRARRRRLGRRRGGRPASRSTRRAIWDGRGSPRRRCSPTTTTTSTWRSSATTIPRPCAPRSASATASGPTTTSSSCSTPTARRAGPTRSASTRSASRGTSSGRPTAARTWATT